LSAVQIDRFNIVRTLGEGAQGAVYLAHDPRLGRQVAIKTLHVAPGDRASTAEMLAQEARTVGQLSHPNIVTLYDAGQLDGEPYLVFEYVEGETLESVLAKQGKLPVARAVQTAVEILEGIAYAHNRGILHRDIKPGNIIYDDTGIARVMDFGVATTVAAGDAGGGFSGTPLYAAPEYIQSGRYLRQSDIYSVAAVLYQLLTGRTTVRGATMAEIFQAVVRGDIAPPSRFNSDVDERLDSIVLRGLAGEPDARYPTAEAMLEALKTYLDPSQQSDGDGGSASRSTIDFLLRRMRHKSDFPALTESIQTINRIVKSDSESASTLSNVILKDFALTNKLLRVVNAATYGQFGKVNTISRAVVILGFEAVRNMALSIMLINHLQNHTQAKGLREEVIGTFLGGVIARQLYGPNDKCAEEAFIGALYQNLGKMLGLYYFHEESQEIARLVQQGVADENVAANKVLGISYEQLAVEVAKHWNFPDSIVGGIRKIRDEQVPKPGNHQQRVHVIANMADDLRRITSSSDGDEREREVQALLTRYELSVPLSKEKLKDITEKALVEFREEAPALNLELKGSAVVQQAATWANGMVAPTSNKTDGVDAALGNADLARTVMLGENVANQAPAPGTPPDAEAIMSAGIQDITQTLVGEYDLNDLLRMILETMYRGMGFSRVLLATGNAAMGAIAGRFGLGEGVKELIASFKVPLTGSPDLFKASLQQGRDIFITDSSAANVQQRLPTWYLERVNAPSFVLFPILVDKKPIGLFYADGLAAGQFRIGRNEANLLTTLRNQAVLAIKQRSPGRT
jgi:serine/threonine protein kinase